MASIANLPRLTSKRLSELILAQDAAGKPGSIAIVDVRDDDYIGGHIKGAMNFPSRNLNATMPSLIRKLEDKETVIFHCALSQQRGPGAALRYIRERDEAAKSKPEAADGAAEKSEAQQKVYVLDRGFVGWQEEYGENESLTEGYRKELWKDGYWM